MCFSDPEPKTKYYYHEEIIPVRKRHHHHHHHHSHSSSPRASYSSFEQRAYTRSPRPSSGYRTSGPAVYERSSQTRYV